MCEIFGVFFDALTFMRLYFRSTAALTAENLFLRKQLSLLVERKVRPEEPRIRSVSLSPDFPDGSIGGMHLSSSNPTR
jgi:hypothetical protein